MQLKYKSIEVTLTLHWNTFFSSVLPSLHSLYSRYYLGHNNYLQLLSKFAQNRVMFSCMLLIILEWWLSQLKTGILNRKSNLKYGNDYLESIFLLYPILTFTVFFKYEQNSQSWPVGPDCTQELTGILTIK